MYSPIKKKKGFIPKVIRYVKTLPSIWPKYTNNFLESEFNSTLAAVIEITNPANICFESPFFLPIINEVAENIEIDIAFHNHESDFLFQLAKSETNLSAALAYCIESLKTFHLENRLFNNTLKRRSAWRAIFLTPQDFKSYKRRFALKNENCILNENKLFLEYKIIRRPNLRTPFFLFPGSLNFPPNRKGLEWLLNKYDVYPDLEYPVIVTGYADAKTLKSFQKFRKFYHAGLCETDKFNNLLEECLAVISPIITGGGIKVKNLEATALGVPLIMTHFSATGISTDQNLSIEVPDDAVQFCEAMRLVYESYIFTPD